MLAGRGAPASGPAAGFLAKVTPQGAVLFVRLLQGEALPPHAEPFGVATSPEGLFLATGGFASVSGEARIHATKTLGLSAGGVPAGVVVTALNAQALLP